MDKSGFAQQTYETAPPDYTTATGSASSSTNPFADPSSSGSIPASVADIRAKYDSVSGINLLKETDTVLVIDDSESMGIYGYWALLEKALIELGRVVAAYDPDGVSAYCLNKRGPSKLDENTGTASEGWNGLTTEQQIHDIFAQNKPKGTTPIYDRLQHILEPYLFRLAKDPENRPRPINILILTDGVADDTDGVEEQIGEFCTVLDQYNAPANQVGLQFVQIGDLKVAEQHIRNTWRGNEAKIQELTQKAYNDYEAAGAWLQKLDDDLKGNAANVTRDMVDTKNSNALLEIGGFTPAALVMILVGALSKRHDRMKAK